MKVKSQYRIDSIVVWILVTSCENQQFLLSLIFLRHKIKDGGYNNTNINKQLSPAQNTPALQAMALL